MTISQPVPILTSRWHSSATRFASAVCFFSVAVNARYCFGMSRRAICCQRRFTRAVSSFSLITGSFASFSVRRTFSLLEAEPGSI